MTLGRIKPKDFGETSGLLFPSVETLEKLNTQTLGAGPELGLICLGSEAVVSLRAQIANMFKAFPLSVLGTESVQNKQNLTLCGFFRAAPALRRRPKRSLPGFFPPFNKGPLKKKKKGDSSLRSCHPLPTSCLLREAAWTSGTVSAALRVAECLFQNHSGTQRGQDARSCGNKNKGHLGEQWLLPPSPKLLPLPRQLDGRSKSSRGRQWSSKDF